VAGGRGQDRADAGGGRGDLAADHWALVTTGHWSHCSGTSLSSFRHIFYADSLAHFLTPLLVPTSLIS
jgi:hypothetical protein